jgi:hypothetical protein
MYQGEIQTLRQLSMGNLLEEDILFRPTAANFAPFFGVLLSTDANIGHCEIFF